MQVGALRLGLVWEFVSFHSRSLNTWNCRRTVSMDSACSPGNWQNSLAAGNSLEKPAQKMSLSHYFQSPIITITSPYHYEVYVVFWRGRLVHCTVFLEEINQSFLSSVCRTSNQFSPLERNSFHQYLLTLRWSPSQKHTRFHGVWIPHKSKPQLTSCTPAKLIRRNLFKQKNQPLPHTTRSTAHTCFATGKWCGEVTFDSWELVVLMVWCVGDARGFLRSFWWAFCDVDLLPFVLVDLTTFSSSAVLAVGVVVVFFFSELMILVVVLEVFLVALFAVFVVLVLTVLSFEVVVVVVVVVWGFLGFSDWVPVLFFFVAGPSSFWIACFLVFLAVGFLTGSPFTSGFTGVDAAVSMTDSYSSLSPSPSSPSPFAWMEGLVG